MASILKRTVFYDNKDNVKRFWDWAIVQTTLGTMAEPFCVNNRHSINVANQQFDPTSIMCRIDDMVEADMNKSAIMLSGGSTQLHGGTLIPRTGR